MRASLAKQMLDAVDQAVEGRWAGARVRAAELGDGSRSERVELLTTRIRKELGLVGAAAGGAAAIPGVGLGAASATFAAEIAWSTVRLADLILTIAVVHGHDRAGPEERRMWVLSILTYREGAANMVAQLATEMQASPTRRGARRLSERTLRRMNATMGRAIVGRYGTRRGVAALGRAVPFGVGAALGYGINARAVSATARHAHAFFESFPISLDAIDVDAIDVDATDSTVRHRPVRVAGEFPT